MSRGRDVLDAAHRIVSASPFGFLTTALVTDRATCRLVQHLEVGPGCEITFATSASTRKARAMRKDPQVLYAVFDAPRGAAATLRAVASMDADIQRKQTLWRPGLDRFFPGGASSVDVILVTLRPYEVEVWSVIDGLTPPPHGLSSASTHQVDGDWSPAVGTHP